MPTEATEILTVAAARKQLRIDADLEDDDLVTQAIKAAVSFVEAKTGKPLLDVLETVECYPRVSAAAIKLPRHVAEVQEVRYWEPSQQLREAPTGTVAVDDLGRVVAIDAATWLYPPASGWPVRLADSGIQVTALKRFAPIPPGLIEAVILMTRHAYEGPHVFESNFAVHALIAPWIDVEV